MKKLSKIIHYWFLKPTQEGGQYFFIRSQTDGMDNYSWFMGYENHLGIVSSVGGSLSGTLVDQLEKEFQESIKN